MSKEAQNWNSRGHFFAAAAEAMQRILIDNARRKRRPKHGGDRERVDLEEFPMTDERADQLVALDERSKSCRRNRLKRQISCDCDTSPDSRIKRRPMRLEYRANRRPVLVLCKSIPSLRNAGCRMQIKIFPWREAIRRKNRHCQ